MGTKYVYSFNEGNKDMKSLLGGKGANLAEMTKIGLPVPPGFTISTEACNDYYVSNKTIKPEIVEQIEEKLAQPKIFFLSLYLFLCSVFKVQFRLRLSVIWWPLHERQIHVLAVSP